MKKFIYLLFAPLLFCSCENDKLFELPTQGGTMSGDLPEVIYANVADNDSDSTKTRTFVDNMKVLWNKGDEIFYGVRWVVGAKYVFNGEDGTASAEFTQVTNGENATAFSDIPLGVFPYRDNLSASYNENTKTWTVTPEYEQYQNYVPNSFDRDANIMIATGKYKDDNNLYFRNACGYLVIKLYGTNVVVNNIVLFANDKGNLMYGKKYDIEVNSNGEFTYKPNTIPFVEWQYTTELNCKDSDGQGVRIGEDKEHATEFWFALPPMTFNGGLSVRVDHSTGYRFLQTTTKDIVIERNTVQQMAAFDATESARVNNLWYRTVGDQPLEKFGKEEDNYPLTSPYFDAQIINHFRKYNKEKDLWMYCIEFDRPLTEIKKDAFKDGEVTNIQLPDGLKIIGESAFEDNALTSVTLPRTVTTIEKAAFKNNEGLTEVNTSVKLTTIGDEAFYDTRFTEIDLPETLTYIGEGAFSYVPLTSITIPGAVNTIGADAFYDCDSLTSVTFQPSQTMTPLNIGYTISASDANGPFYYSPLTTINLDRELVLTDDEGNPFTPNDWAEGLFANEHYGDEDNQNQGVSVTIGEQVKTISDYMFAQLNLQSITIPASVTSVGLNAFIDCDYLNTVVFEDGETPLPVKYQYASSAYWGPFYDSPLTSITLGREIEYVKEDGTKYTPGETNDGFFTSEESVESLSVTLSDNVKTISEYMFAGRPIQQLTIPASVTFIGKNAFDDCTKLSKVTFESGSQDLHIGFQDHSSDVGTFYDSPLTNIYLDRELVYDYDDLDTWDEGIFANAYYDDKEYLEQGVSVTLGEQVKTLSDYMFNRLPVQTLTIPANVATIGNNVFEECNKLTSVSINTSTLGSNMFKNCENLATVTIGGTLNTINVDAFIGCSKLSTLNISGTVGSIGDEAFDGYALTSLNISGHVGTIGANAFKDNDKMTSFTVTGSVGTIGESAFEDSDALTTVSITGIVNEVCSYAFSDCDNVTTLAIHANKVGDRAYEDMDGLISATLYGATVGNGVFYDCNALQTVVIDGGVNSIGNDAFYNCGKLSSVTFNESANKLIIGYQPSSTDDVGPFYQSPLATINLYREIEPSATYKEQLNAWDMGIFTNKHYEDVNLTTTVELGSNVKTIWPYMFSHVRMQNVTTPASVTSIGTGAFSYCYILTEVTIDGTVDAINADVFTECSTLSTLNIPGSIGTIGAFTSLNLTSLNISGHVGTIGANAFDDNDMMTSFTVTSTGSIGTIGTYAFEDCDALTVDIQGPVDRVCSYAFSDCDAITTLSIRAGVVDDYAYEDMDGLNSATLYGATVGSYVFYDCDNLETLVIDGGVTFIGNNAFDDCTKLSSVTFESGSQDLHIGFQDHSSDVGTFYDSPLTYISLDRELVYDYDDLDTWDEGIFASPNYDNDEFPVVTVTLGNNVKTILPWMFSGVRMETVEIPTSVTYIGKRAFSYCYILTEVSCRNTTPPTLGEDVFLNDKDKYNNNLTIKVPYVSGDEYREKWSQYEHKVWGTFVN